MGNERDFASNLRLLCSRSPSIAEICRRLPMNRQQFNRYLQGRTRPRGRNLTRILDYFRVDEAELLLPHAEFRARFGRRHAEAPGLLAPVQGWIDRLGRHAGPEMERYAGYYLCTYRSMSHPGRWLRSLVRIYARDGMHFYKRLERSGGPAAGSGPRFVYKYEGIALMLSGRIFMVDAEALANFELSYAVVLPSYGSRIGVLQGLMAGVSATAARQPTSGPIFLEHLGRTVDVRAALRRCGLLAEGEGPAGSGPVPAGPVPWVQLAVGA